MHSVVRSRALRAEPRTEVSFFYELADGEGRLIECSNLAETIVLGCGQASPSLESALLGLVVGESRSVTLPPGEAFGYRSPAAILTVTRAEFPDHVAAGDEFSAENLDGGHVFVRVLEVTDDSVTLDTNHPLAGEAVVLTVELDAVRRPTGTELERAMQRKPLLGVETLLPVSRLRERGASVEAARAVRACAFS
jgi:FKBP-type peptidyl-prolyl cis-trans isomerase SlyD